MSFHCPCPRMLLVMIILEWWFFPVSRQSVQDQHQFICLYLLWITEYCWSLTRQSCFTTSWCPPLASPNWLDRNQSSSVFAYHNELHAKVHVPARCSFLSTRFLLSRSSVRSAICNQYLTGSIFSTKWTLQLWYPVPYPEVPPMLFSTTWSLSFRPCQAFSIMQMRISLPRKGLD